MAIETVNPATEEVIKTFDPYPDDEVSSIIKNVSDDFQNWKRTDFYERKSLMMKIYHLTHICLNTEVDTVLFISMKRYAILYL